MLLSRTADNLFWMARYIERAESTARLLDVGRRMASVVTEPDAAASEWASTIDAAGCEATFASAHDIHTAGNVIDHLVRDVRNPSSIFASLAVVRQNARVVRTALSQDVWDAVNGMWIESQAWRDDDFTVAGLPRILDWVKERSQRFGGAVANTMLRSEAYWWVRLGTFLERAENSARIVDVKYHVLIPRPPGEAGPLDEYQWGAVLRAVSAYRAYHWVYRDRLDPVRVAELMILRPEMPRSLVSCIAQVTYYLERIASDGSHAPDGGASPVRADLAPERGEVSRRPLAISRAIEDGLRTATIERIYGEGLHEFLTRFIGTMNSIGHEIRREYLLGE